MQNIREMKPWTDTELCAYGNACSIFKERCEESSNKAPNFKKIFNEELAKFARKKVVKQTSTT